MAPGEPTLLQWMSITVSQTNPFGALFCLRGFYLGFIFACSLGALWLLKGVLSAKMENFHLNYMCVFIHRLMYIIGFLDISC